jgi:hypothetical protein
MLRWISKNCVLLGCFSLATAAAPAQQVVHALAGTISSINAAAKTITVITDDGSGGTFRDLTDTKTPLEFDKGLRAGATPAAAFKDQQGHVVVYYFGEGEIRTAVALRELGPGPFTVVSGTVDKFEKRTHSFSIKTEAGTEDSFKITSDTVADIGSGATEGLKFEADKGYQVRVVSANLNGVPTALFVIILATS